MTATTVSMAGTVAVVSRWTSCSTWASKRASRRQRSPEGRRRWYCIRAGSLPGRAAGVVGARATVPSGAGGEDRGESLGAAGAAQARGAAGVAGGGGAPLADEAEEERALGAGPAQGEGGRGLAAELLSEGRDRRELTGQGGAGVDEGEAAGGHEGEEQLEGDWQRGEGRGW